MIPINVSGLLYNIAWYDFVFDDTFWLPIIFSIIETENIRFYLFETILEIDQQGGAGEDGTWAWKKKNRGKIAGWNI